MAELPEDLSELTVVQLKKELSDRGITVKGRKADLVERLDEARTHEPEGTAAGEDGTSSPAESAPTKAAAEATSEPTTEDSAPAASETAKTDEADQERVGNVTAAEPKPVAQASTNVDAPAVAAATKEPQPQTTSTDSADASNGAPTPKRRRWRQSTEARQQSAEDAVIDANALQAMVQESLPTPAEAMDDGQDDVKEPKPGAMNRDNDAGTEDSTGPAAETGPCFVQVRNLKRPFTLIALKELLSQHGTILDNTFMTDKVRSRCFAKFETPAQARATADALNGMQWPSIHGQNLRVTVEATNTLAEQVAEQQAAAAAQHREQPPTADAPKQARPAAPRKPKEEPVVGLLDDLFRKTKTHPHLYWLPNSEAEAQAEGERRRERQAAKEARERAPARRSRSRSRSPPMRRGRRRSFSRSRSPVGRRSPLGRRPRSPFGSRFRGPPSPRGGRRYRRSFSRSRSPPGRSYSRSRSRSRSPPPRRGRSYSRSPPPARGPRSPGRGRGQAPMSPIHSAPRHRMPSPRGASPPNRMPPRGAQSPERMPPRGARSPGRLPPGRAYPTGPPMNMSGRAPVPTNANLAPPPAARPSNLPYWMTQQK